MYSQDGYKVLTPIQICNVLSAFDLGLIRFRGLKVYFGCIELIAIREAAARASEQKGKGKERKTAYKKSELLRLIPGVTEGGIKKELSSLKKAGLLSFEEQKITITEYALPCSEDLLADIAGSRSPTRKIPLPRKVIKFIARSKKQSIVKTVLAYVLRGLTFERGTGKVKGKGTAKASWIADTFGLSLRSVKNARVKLIELGWISKDTGSKQTKLNRDGAYFEINLSWYGKIRIKEEQKEAMNLKQIHGKPRIEKEVAIEIKPLTPTKEEAPKVITQSRNYPATIPQAEKAGAVTKPTEAKVILPFKLMENSTPKPRQFAPPQAENRVIFAPPYIKLETSKEDKNQKTRTTKPAGVFTKQNEEPRITNVITEDLHNFTRMESLYFQAVKKGLVRGSENDALNFLAAAIRAREAKGDAPKIFIGIVKKRLWMNITQAQEEQARRAFVKYREIDHMRFRFN